MAWTTPRTWVSTEVLTAALLNTHLRDNLSYLYDGVAGGTRFQNDARITWALPAVTGSGNETGSELAYGSNLSTLAWDSTNKWVYMPLVTTASGTSVAYVAGSPATRCTVQLLPEFMAGVMHVTTTANVIRVGLCGLTPAGGDPADAIMFRSTNGGNWFAVVRNASTETATDTGIAASTTAPKELRIVATATNNIQFLIDGTIVRTETGANIPATTVLLRPQVLIEETAAAAKTLRVAQRFLVGYESKSS